MNKHEEGQTEQVSEQRLIVKWASSNNTNLVLLRQAPVHATPFLVFLNTFCTLKSSEMCIRFIGVT
jgi:hypothetical protein